MFNYWRIITAFFGVIVLGTSVSADMMPVSPVDDQPQKSFQSSDLSNLSTHKGIDNPNLWPIKLYPETSTDLSPAYETQPPKISTDRLGSINLYLSTLFCIGLYSSINWMKKHPFGSIPEWYHNGGPYQIGHSFAVAPDFLLTGSPTSYCIPPVYTAEDPVTQYRLRQIVSLLRISQFMPNLAAARSPPDMP